MPTPPPFFPDDASFKALGAELVQLLSDSYQQTQPFPASPTPLPALPLAGCGGAGLPELWRMILDGSTHLAVPQMSGHMDTAPHPYAALTQALVSALNNNMLFRELSPVASRIEEDLVDDFITRLGLGANWAGTWASGGSIANLSALFCALGGYDGDVARDRAHLLFPESGHSSLVKAAAILGVAGTRLHSIRCDDAGRMDVDALRTTLAGLPGSSVPVVTSVLGTTIHGSLDDIASIADICEQYGAWHHVDAIYGGALMFSKLDWPQLGALARADSIVLGPQKWMYVPRVSATILIRGRELYDRRMGVAMPYSVSGEVHRGFWGIQGSRPADAIVLWTLLQTLGTDALGTAIDRNIQLTRRFHAILSDSALVAPTHLPDLNLLVMRPLGAREASEIQQRLTAAGGFWTSVSNWRGQGVLRAVLLSPLLTTDHLDEFRDALEVACR